MPAALPSSASSSQPTAHAGSDTRPPPMSAATPSSLPGSTAGGHQQPARRLAWARGARMPLLIGLGVLLACLAGIAMRPTGFFSCFWPANALLVGVLVRLRLVRRPAVWAGAFAGYVAADLINGSTWTLATWLTGANLAGVLMAALLLRRLAAPVRQLRCQLSALHLLRISVAASGVAALVGGGAGPAVFGTAWLPSLSMWFSSELLNYLLILPVMLTAPARGRLGTAFATRHSDIPAWKQVGPLLAVLGAEVLVPFVGGPWSVAMVVPALLWCAVTYSRFVTALLCLAVCLWKTVELAAVTALAFSPDQWQMILALRLGIAMLSLGPLAVASAMASRDARLLQLGRAKVGDDDMASFLAQSPFTERARDWLERPLPEGQRRPVGLLMIGVDSLPPVIARHGRTTGERVRAAFAEGIAPLLRTEEPLAALGEEKFVLLLPGATDSEAMAAAERLCAATRALPLALAEGQPLTVTVSIGAAFYADVAVPADGTSEALIRSMLRDADRLQARAQNAGRDCVVFRALDRPGSLAETDWTIAAHPT